MDRSEKISFQGSARSLRVIDILAFIPGMVLLLITALTTPAGSIYLIAVAPLTLSALLGLVSVAGKDRPMPPWTRYADLWLAMFFVSVLVPMWVTMARHSTLWSGGVSEILLCAYSTMPLIVDFCIHAYLFFRSIHEASRYSQPRSCPNCKYAVPPPDGGPRWKLDSKTHNMSLGHPSTNQLELIANGRYRRSRGDEARVGNHELYHSDLTDYSQAGLTARESSEFQTSGCNTPRRSAETLSSSRFSGDVDFDEGVFDSLV